VVSGRCFISSACPFLRYHPFGGCTNGKATAEKTAGAGSFGKFNAPYRRLKIGADTWNPGRASVDWALRLLANDHWRPEPVTADLVRETFDFARRSPDDRAQVLEVVSAMLSALYLPGPQGLLKLHDPEWHCRFLTDFLGARADCQWDREACEIMANRPGKDPITRGADAESLRH
jgi:hypothetical protein